MSEESSTSKSNDDKPNLTEKQQNLTEQAYDEFFGKRYSQCLQTLSKLEELSGNKDNKIIYNKALVEFYNSGLKDYKTFLKFLNEEIDHFDQNKDDSKNNSKIISFLQFNKAIILYHLNKPYSALQILTPFLEKLDEIDEMILHKAGILFLNLLIETRQLNKAYKFLKKFEKFIGFSCVTNSTLLSPLTSVADEVNKGNNLESLNDSNKIDDFKRNFKLISYLTNIINDNNVSIPNDSDIEFSFLKAFQFYVGKDFQMAAKQFLKKFPTEAFSIETHGMDPDTCIANNMGVIHLRVRHYAIAANFFQHAIHFDNKVLEKISAIESQPLYLLNVTKRPEIYYNLGVAMLHLQRPYDAFECFMLPLHIYSDNPRIWLRIAEACIQVYEMQNRDKECKGVIASVIGSGLHRKYLLRPTPLVKVSNQTSSDPAPTLEFAVVCLRNAAAFAEKFKEQLKQQQKSKTDGEEDDWKNVQDSNFCNPSMPISLESLERLLAKIYASYSFVSIRLGDYIVGLEYAHRLLKMENLSDVNIMLGHLYCAEALINLNKLNEARSYLERKFITNSNPHDFETKDWQINSLEAAQAVLKYNLIVTLVLQGEFGVAKALLISCNHPVVAAKCKALKMFIDLAEDVNPVVDNNVKLKAQRF